VALDDSGNAYLTGAGFVVSLAGAPRVSSRFVAPELGRGEPITSAADVWSLGALTAQLFDGRVSSEEITRLIAEATADQPDRRIASMEEFLSEFGAAFGQQEPQVSFTVSRNPYKGLEAFTEADAADFFGRSDSVEELAAMLAEHRLVAVVGPSGSGKSSLVKAGLIPAVRAGAVDGSRRWVVTDMSPGSYPFVELESTLARVAVTDPGSVLDELDRDERGLLRVITRILPGDTRLLLVIDQFEEVFTLTRNDNTRSAFLDALVALAADERSDTRVVITLRADFFDRPLQHPEFGGMLKAGMFALTAPTAERLGDAVQRPAEAVGVGWEAGLVDQIVADVTNEPGTLPLLQYALTELFASRDADRLTHDGYRATGGVLGALGIRADGVFEQLDRGNQDVARQLFLRLVTVRSSREQTRRRARMVELKAVAEPGDVDAVLTAFGGARLLTFDRDPVTRGPTVEVAHEALLTRWPRLADWITEAREDLLLHQRLADAVDEWDGRDRDEGYLLSGGRLAQFAAWAGTTELTLTGMEGEYLELSEIRSEELRTRRRRIRNLVTAGFAAAAVIGLVLATFAFLSRQEAAANAELARSRELAASAINVLDEDPELSLLLALEGASGSDPPIESVSAVHEGLANHRKIFTYNWPPEREHNSDLDARLSPDGHTLVAAAGSNYLEVVDVDSGERLWDREFPDSGRARAAFTPDGSKVVVGYGWVAGPGEQPDPATESALGVHLLDARTGESIRHFPVGPCGLVTAEMYVVEVAGAASLVAGIPRDSSCTFSGDEFGPSFPPVSLLDLDTGEIEPLADRPDHVYLTPDAHYLMFQEPNDGPVVVIDRRENRQVAAFDGTAGAEGISADGSLALTWSLDQEPALDVWDLTSGQAGEPLATIDGFEGWFTPGGDALWVNAFFDAVPVQLWDLQAGERADELLTGLASAWQLTQSNDGSRVLVNERGDSAVVFELGASTGVSSMKLCREFDGQTGEVEVAGQLVSVYAGCENDGSLGTQFVVDLDPFALRASIPHQAGTSALSLDGRLLATQIGEPPATLGQAVLRDTTDGGVSKTMEGLCTWIEGEPGPECVEFPETPYPDWPWDFAFSPDGELLAMAGQYTDGVTVWDAETGLIVAQPTVAHDSVEPYQTLDVEFSPEGEHMVVSFFIGGPPELWLLSTDDWAPVGRYAVPDDAEGEDAPVAGLVFTPDGEILVGTDFSVFGQGQIVFMDGSTLEHLDRIPDAHDGGINDLAINAEGTLLASAGVDGFVRVWDLETRTVVHQIPISNVGGVGGVAFLESGEHLAASSQADGELRIVTLDTGELLDIARTRLTRTFTETECATYRVDPCPTLVDVKAG
jgi:WD40 repeat protein